jgi:hypothetical protein
MKRIAGAMTPLLLTGMLGCLQYQTPISPETKRPGEMRVTTLKSSQADPTLPPATATASTNTGPMPATAQWNQGDYSGNQVPRNGLVDYTAGRQPLPPLLPTPPATNVRQASLPALQPVAARTTQPAPAPQPPAPPQPPAVATATAMAEMPSVTTPKNEPKIDSNVQQAHNVQSEPVARTAVPMPPTPSVKGSTPTEPKQASSTAMVKGAPLFRLVNTKRITLNFEVKDVGASGVSAVELWFTQDGKEWKKHDAPAQAKAYVVEVDDEGMYGFTLLARSGTGLAKDPPQPGDAPQVWVIVDLTKPEVSMGDVNSSMQGGQQTVSIKWKASDKNLGRQPVTLSYAEKEEGPWKVVAAGLDAVGTYNWEAPKGTPAKVLFRVEATDLAGNVGRAQLSKPVLMDNAVPTVLINSVDANSSH